MNVYWRTCECIEADAIEYELPLQNEEVHCTRYSDIFAINDDEKKKLRN